MYLMDAGLAMALMAMRLEQARGQSGSRHLVRQGRAWRTSWVSRQSRRLVGRLGELLVAVGQRLQRRHLPQMLPLEGDALGGR